MRSSSWQKNVFSSWQSAARGVASGGDHGVTNSILSAKADDTSSQSMESNSSISEEIVSDAKMDEIRARVFGYHLGNGLRSGRKILRKKLVGDMIASYYIEPIKDPLMLNLKQEA